MPASTVTGNQQEDAQLAELEKGSNSNSSPPPSVTRNPVSSVKPPQNVHPSAKGVYGSPVDANPPLK
jgi:hypothetical protein